MAARAQHGVHRRKNLERGTSNKEERHRTQSGERNGDKRGRPSAFCRHGPRISSVLARSIPSGKPGLVSLCPCLVPPEHLGLFKFSPE